MLFYVPRIMMEKKNWRMNFFIFFFNHSWILKGVKRHDFVAIENKRRQKAEEGKFPAFFAFFIFKFCVFFHIFLIFSFLARSLDAVKVNVKRQSWIGGEASFHLACSNFTMMSSLRRYETFFPYLCRCCFRFALTVCVCSSFSFHSLIHPYKYIFVW